MSKTSKTKEAKIEVRVTKEFKEVLQRKAKEAGLTLSEYIHKLLEHRSVAILNGGNEFAKELLKLRMTLDENGLSKKDEHTIQSLIVKINELIDSLPQNRSDLCEEDDDTLDLLSDDDDEDYDDEEEWEEGGDLI